MNNWHSLRFRMSSSSCLCGGMCRSHVRDEVLWNWDWSHGAGSTSLRCPMWSSLVIGLWLRFGSWVRAPVFFLVENWALDRSVLWVFWNLWLLLVDCLLIKMAELTQFATELQLSRTLEKAEVEIVRRLSTSIGLVRPGGACEYVASSELIPSAACQTRLVDPFLANRL